MKKNDLVLAILFWSLVVIGIVMIVMRVGVHIRYADTPVDDIPHWAYVWLYG